MSQRKLHLLIVEDNQALALNLSEYLNPNQYESDFARDGLTALHLLATNHYDVIVLDVMLPGVSGFEIARRVRQDLLLSTPILLMTAKSQIEDKVEGFENGADDYLVKPFHLKELVLRIHSLYERGQLKNKLLHVGRLQFDLNTLRVSYAGQPSLLLTATHARILEMLMRAMPAYVPYQRMAEELFPDKVLGIKSLRTHVYSLRKVLMTQYNISMIQTLPNSGYVMSNLD